MLPAPIRPHTSAFCVVVVEILQRLNWRKARGLDTALIATTTSSKSSVQNHQFKSPVEKVISSDDISMFMRARFRSCSWIRVSNFEPLVDIGWKSHSCFLDSWIWTLCLSKQRSCYARSPSSSEVIITNSASGRSIDEVDCILPSFIVFFSLTLLSSEEDSMLDWYAVIIATIITIIWL